MCASRNRLNYLTIVILAAHFFFATAPAAAISLELVPANQTVGPGGQATVDVIVADPGSNLVSTYDFFVNYNPDVLTLNSILFGTALGGGVPDSLQDFLDSPVGAVNVSELSLLPSVLLPQDGIQDILLFSMVFDKDAFGTSPLTFTGNIGGAPGDFLGDDNGLVIALDSVGSGSINVVPIPAAVWLMGSGLLALFGFTGWSRKSD